MVQIEKSQCLSNREFPEFFKTHPTFIIKSNFKASRTQKPKRRGLLWEAVYPDYHSTKKYEKVPVVGTAYHR